MKPGVKSSIENSVEPLTRTHARACFALVLAALALFLPGFFTLQPMDRDEPRFAQATKQMLETGDYIAIRFQGDARNKKPVGIYWMQAAVVGAADALGVPDARRKIWLYRIPSLLGALAAVLLTYWTALAFVGRRAAFLAALLFASTLLIGVEARLAKTDAVVTATVIAAMGAMARVYLGATAAGVWRAPAIFWTAIGLGLLVKGPITPMVPLLAFLALAGKDRAVGWARALKPLPGLAWALLLVAPWFALIMIETQGAFLRDSVGADMLSKVRSGQEAHGAPPLTYFAVFWATGWPLAPFVALAAPFAWSARRTREVAFLLAWVVPTWLVFELTPTKLPHYVLPVYPALAILAAMAIEKGAADGAARWRRIAMWWLPLFAMIVVAVGLGGAIWLGRWPGSPFLLGAPAAVALAIVVARRLGQAGALGLALAAPALAWALYFAVYGGVLGGPMAQTIGISPALARAHADLEARTAGCDALAPATTFYREPSLVFLTRTDLVMTNGAGAAAFLQAGPCRVAFVDSRAQAQFRAAVGGDARILEDQRVRGINVNGGRKTDIGVYVRGGGR